MVKSLISEHLGFVAQSWTVNADGSLTPVDTQTGQPTGAAIDIHNVNPSDYVTAVANPALKMAQAANTPTAQTDIGAMLQDFTNPLVGLGFGGAAATTNGIEAQVKQIADAALNTINPPINTQNNQKNPTSSTSPSSGGALSSLINWVKNNPALAAAIGLTVVGGAIYLGKKLLGSTAGTPATSATRGTRSFYETYTRAGKTIKRRKYNREHKRRR